MSIDIEWARAQMKAADLLQPTQSAVERLLVELDKMMLSDAATTAVTATFTRLAQGHALVTEQAHPSEVWVQARPGSLVVADEVRVKADAYDGVVGTNHNGRRGNIVAIRYGNVYVKYHDNRAATAESMHHKPAALEKRMR